MLNFSHLKKGFGSGNIDYSKLAFGAQLRKKHEELEAIALSVFQLLFGNQNRGVIEKHSTSLNGDDFQYSETVTRRYRNMVVQVYDLGVVDNFGGLLSRAIRLREEGRLSHVYANLDGWYGFVVFSQEEKDRSIY